MAKNTTKHTSIKGSPYVEKSYLKACVNAYARRGNWKEMVRNLNDTDMDEFKSVCRIVDHLQAEKTRQHQENLAHNKLTEMIGS